MQQSIKVKFVREEWTITILVATGKFGDCIFNRFGFIVQIHTHTHIHE